MITFQQERWADCYNEILAIATDHWKEVSPYHDIRPLDVNVEYYQFLEDKGAFFLYTARNTSKTLVGYSMFALIKLAHYKNITVANNDTLYLSPEARKGLTGYKFIKKTEEELLKLNIQEIVWKSKVGDKNFGKLLNRLGYLTEEVVYTKMVNVKG